MLIDNLGHLVVVDLKIGYGVIKLVIIRHSGSSYVKDSSANQTHE